MGVMYKTEDTKLHPHVAVKIIPHQEPISIDEAVGILQMELMTN